MTWGKKYKGVRMGDIPADYLLWIYDKRLWGRRRDLLIYLMENEKALRREAARVKRNGEIITEIFGGGNGDE